MHIHMHIHTYIHTYTHTYIHIYNENLYIYIYIYIYPNYLSPRRKPRIRCAWKTLRAFSSSCSSPQYSLWPSPGSSFYLTTEFTTAFTTAFTVLSDPRLVVASFKSSEALNTVLFENILGK